MCGPVCREPSRPLASPALIVAWKHGGLIPATTVGVRMLAATKR
ncbi:MAG: hypothetical protein BWY17_05159 [Deltaproteobacteria bacterium ADurb.Bin207]|nr:MAG: hypothetical protein BWY17_05159 [Deltaproteobacteria bacterium ADurb.Bin207]